MPDPNEKRREMKWRDRPADYQSKLLNVGSAIPEHVEHQRSHLPDAPCFLCGTRGFCRHRSHP